MDVLAVAVGISSGDVDKSLQTGHLDGHVQELLCGCDVNLHSMSAEETR